MPERDYFPYDFMTPLRKPYARHAKKAVKMPDMHHTLLTAVDYLQEHFFARWILANIAGWSLGLYLGSLCLSMFGGLFGLVLGGALAGGLAGAAQWYALQGAADWAERRWIW